MSMKMKTAKRSSSSHTSFYGSSSMHKTVSSRASIGGDTSMIDIRGGAVCGVDSGENGTAGLGDGANRSTSVSPSVENGEGLKPRLSQAKRQWSINAVKGKVTTRCLWNACKALTFGVILIFLGAGMATIGKCN